MCISTTLPGGTTVSLAPLKWEAWAVYDVDGIVALYGNELEALRYAVNDEAYCFKVKKLTAGEIQLD
jgi:hypothetical protein